MTNAESLIEQIYNGIKQDLTSGEILPGQRVNITSYCDRFRVSKSPVRNALYRLVGDGLLEAHLHDGFYRVRILEKSLCDLLVWNEHALDLAFDLIEVGNDRPAAAVDPIGETDHVLAIEQLFGAIAQLGGNTACCREIDALNDLLRPIRLQEVEQWRDLDEELSGLTRAYQTADFARLRGYVHDYHARRIDVVRQLVGLAYRQRSAPA